MKVRNQEILRQLVLNQSMDEQSLGQKLGISSRQLSYSVDQINEQLSEHQIPPIKKKQGKYYCSKEVSLFLQSQTGVNEFSLSAEDRIQVILLTILSRVEDVSLDHLIDFLQVSKNTVVTDIKKCNDYLANYRLQIQYSRKLGYFIEGDEWDKRVVLNNAIHHVYRHYREKAFEQLLPHCMDHKEAVKKTLLKVEQYLGKKYTDEDFYPLIYFITILLVRTRQSKTMSQLEGLDIQEIANTKEYQALLHLSDDFVDISQEEVMYISLQLLGSSSLDRSLREDDLPLLSNSLWEFFTEFETNTRLVLPEKRELHRKFINHFKPAYYRIKYKLPIENVLYEQVTTKYSVLHSFVRQSISPLEKFFQVDIPDKEIAYITMFIGGHILGKDNDITSEKVIRAVILCPNGVSVSKLMEKNLQAVFPEFLFYPPSTVREYEGFMLPHDIVFSTIPVDSLKNVYVVSELLSKHEQLKLRQRVIKDVFKLDFNAVTSADVLEVVKRHGSIEEDSKLLEALDSLLLPKSGGHYELGAFDKHQGLLALMSEEVIRIVEGKPNWEELLTLSSDLLIKQGKITEAYTPRLVEAYRDMPEYVLLNQNIVLPHLDPDLVTQKLGVSLLILKEGILYGGRLIHVVTLMTIPDKESHIDVLFEINRLARNEEVVKRLKQAETACGVMEILRGGAR